MSKDELGSKKAASKGGRARAKALSPEQRRAIAAKGGEAKARKAGKAPTPKATHTGPLYVGNVEFECAVLEGGIRVLSERSFMAGMGIYHSGWISAKRREEASKQGAAVLPLFASHRSLKGFIDKDLEALLAAPLKYRTETGGIAHGIRAETIPRICGIWLKARDAAAANGTALPKRQAQIATQADLIIRALAEVGIIALVDEATGYQYDRPRRDLEEYLEKFLSEHLRKWVRTFPSDYFKELCRLQGVDVRSDMRLPQYFGTLTNNLVYRRIAPGLLRRLKDRRAESGKASNKLHSWLSEDVGLREVLVHLGTVVGLMKIHTDYDEFVGQLDRVAPIYPDAPGLFDDPADWDERRD